MLEKVSSMDVQWDRKINKAIFSGSLTGYLTTDSQHSLAQKSLNTTKLNNELAREKCIQLDRCRLVLEAGKFNRKSPARTQDLVHAFLVPPNLHHADIPEIIDGVKLFDDRRMQKNDVRIHWFVCQ